MKRRGGQKGSYRGDFGDRLAARSYPDLNSGCWLFYGRSSGGYSFTDIGGQRTLAHRASWEWHNGQKIPDGLLVCHKCDTPACVNPDHLFLGTPADNAHDMWRKGRGKVLIRPGSSHLSAKLTEADIPAIVAEYMAGASSSVIAEKYAVHKNTIGAILRGDKWSHIDVQRPRAGADRSTSRNRRTGYTTRRSKIKFDHPPTATEPGRANNPPGMP